MISQKEHVPVFLTMAMYPLDRSCFIDNQRLYVLEPSGGRTLSLKQALSLSSLPEYEAMYSPYGKWDRDTEKREYWKTVDSSHERTEFLKFLGGNADAPLTERRLLCVTSSAGIGKSIALEQARFLRSQLPGQVVLYYHLSRFPNSVESFWGRGSGDATHESVFKRIDKQLSASQSRHRLPKAYYSGIEAWLTHKMFLGQVTLFIDGLDEVDSSNAGPRTAAIKSILEEHPNLHCMVAGRPYAITDAYWNTIFGNDSEPGFEDPSSDWTFCCVGMFDPKQIERSLGPTRTRRIQELAGELELTPRTIEVLRKLPERKFVEIKTMADVYWQSLSETLRIDVEHEKKGLKTVFTSKILTNQYVEYLAALAITMFHRKDAKVDYDSIRLAILERLQTIPGWKNETISELDKKQEAVKELNTGWVEFHFFQDASKEIHWRNQTLRDFFAALWMVRYSSEQEIEQLIERIPARPQEPDDNEVWEFISSMPAEAQVAGSAKERYKRWLHLTDAIFQQPATNPRPTQLMWYAWPRLEEWITPPQESSMPMEVSSRAREIRDRFLGEFDRLQRAPGSGQILQEDLIFVPIGPLNDGSWNVAVGHPEESDNKPRLLEDPLGPYSVSKYPITRRLYNVFDRNHQVHYEDDSKLFSPETSCPVIKANWFDAKMFSIWSKSRLLTEWEWEYACRGNVDAEANRKLTHWQTDPKDDTERKKVAWISSNSQNRTWPVDAKQDGSHTNDFGLVDMLGNVWEWTESTYKAGTVTRVLRGGSFHDFGRNASASCRRHYGPSLTLIFFGFRVARAREGKS